MNPRLYFPRGGVIPPPRGQVGELSVCVSRLFTSDELVFPGNVFRRNTAQLSRLVSEFWWLNTFVHIALVY